MDDVTVAAATACALGRRGPLAVPGAGAAPDHRGADADPAAAGPGVEVVLGHRPGGRVGRSGGGAAARRLAPAGAPQPGGVHGPRPRPRGAVPPDPRAGRRLHGRARPHVPLRHARPPRRRHDQPPRGDGARGRRAGAGRPPAGRGPRGRGAGRRRRHQRGRRPRGDEPGRGVAPRRAVRGREQPLGPVDAGERAVRLRRPGRPGRRLRHAGAHRRRQRRRGRARRGGVGGRAGPGGQRSHPARVQDLPHARARGGVGHRLRPRRAARRLGRARPDRPLRGPARRVGPDGPR